MRDQLQLSRRATKVLAAIDAGETLCVRNGRALDDINAFWNGSSFWLEPSGKSAAPTAVAELIHKAKIVPSEDGLWPGYSQTWRAAP